MIGRALADGGFGLVTGSWPGVDRQTSDAFLAALERRSHDAVGRFTQIHYRRLWPLSSVAPRDTRLRRVVASGRAAHFETIRLCDAGILIGGIGGVKEVAFELLSSGRPIFPLPLTGGDALVAYAETLERWADHPVPGMTRAQFMSLSLPIGGRGDALIRLLRAALHDHVDVFLSYRRSDIPGVAGRVVERFSEHFGPTRVFLDTQSIAPGAAFPARIDRALGQCRAMICLIGPRWDLSRLANEQDYVRRELQVVLESGKAVIPLVAFGGQLPSRSQLPAQLQNLLDRQAVRIEDNNAWEAGMVAVLTEVDRIVAEAAVP